MEETHMAFGKSKCVFKQYTLLKAYQGCAISYTHRDESSP